ncbi:S9 family peptidase [Rhodohalobacter halophilus]|uniref:S9 family peptidase n=1 Tax=Rhodohalobacter halophilus TaxID=1812810 RepID=UPI00083FBEF0|nr:prolyl oligopeptidase family serine peptidase [Rhodohalobacter halophilus]
MINFNHLLKFCFASLIFFLIVTVGKAQESPNFSDSYLTPPEEISEEILAPSHLNVSFDHFSPDGNFVVNRKRSGITPLSSFAKPYYNIAGLQIDKKANRGRSLTTQRATTGLELVDTRTGEIRELRTPNNITISNVEWAPDASKIAWLGHTEDATHIYVTDLSSGNSRQITRRPLLATMHNSIQWAADSRSLFAVLIPERRGSEPVRPETPSELIVRSTTDGNNSLRTYQSLLEDRFEGELLEYYITGQLVKIDTQNRRARNIGSPAMIRNVDAAPSGDHVIVQTIQKPFSYIVPVSRFGWTEEIWDLDGEALVTLRTSEANEGDSDEEYMEDNGRRNIQWRPDGEGLSLLVKPEEKDEEETEDQSEEEEDSEESKIADRVIQWLPPFGENDQNVIYESEREMRSVAYSADSDILFITQRRGGNEELFAVYADNTEETFRIYRYDTNDFYANPGNLSYQTSPAGRWAVRLNDEGSHVFLTGTEYFENVEEKAPRPFIDRVEIETGESERIFQSSEDYYESVESILTSNSDQIIIERQSSDEYPNFWIVDLNSNDRTQLTENRDYNEALAKAPRDRFKVTRADGIEFWMEVVMPPEWDGEPLPGFIWHYPREYNDQEDYNESLRRHNKNSYPRIGTRTADIMAKAGYAVLKPDWPIVGDSGTSNDNFVWSIVQNSTAVIDSSEARGYVDRHRMAIGGHSYGAFGTSNAMIHTSFFKAGIAGAGNYNRTLTPLGFQRERSDLWRGMDRYMQMSPIFWADRLDGALLMYHGAEDQNVGTWPTNSRRMFHALNGIGKTAAMYMYPHEAHGPAAEETLLDMWTRWVDWLDVHVK